MAQYNGVRKLDLIVTTCLLLAAIWGLIQAQGFPGRAGTWPTYVLAALVMGVALHLFNLIRMGFRQAEEDKKDNSSEEGNHENSN